MSLATLFEEVENVFRPNGLRLVETETNYIVEALVAGVKPKEIDISLEKRALSILAKSEKYQYSYLCPIDGIEIDESGTIEASVEDGILKVLLPKAKAPRPLKITVK